MKKKALLTSIMTIALCFSLIAGATFALFTSESSVNIAVSSGKVDVTAEIQNVKTYSGKWNETTHAYDSVETTIEGTFTNGGTAVFEKNVLTLDRITPMDKVAFDIHVTNLSNVNILYRYHLVCVTPEGATEEDSKCLFSGMNFSYNGEDFSSVIEYISAWTSMSPSEDNQGQDIPVVIELPESAGNIYQGKSTSICFTVEAVQGNANVENNEVKKYYTFVSDYEENADNTVTFTSSMGVSVTVDKQSFEDGALNNTVMTIELVDTPEAFTVVSDSDNYVAYDIKLPGLKSDNDTAIYVTIPAGVGLDRDNIRVYYNGDSSVESMEITDYDPTSGLVTFKTTHFSEYVVVKDVNQMELVVSEYEACVGESYYATLNAALSNAKKGDTVTLLKDIEYNSADESSRDVWGDGRTCAIAGVWNITFDGDGHTIVAPKDAYLFGGVVRATIKNLNVVLNGESMIYNTYESTLVDVDVAGYAEFGNNTGAYVVYAYNSLVLSDCDCSATLSAAGNWGNYNAVFIGYPLGDDNKIELKFENCVFTGKMVGGTSALLIGNPHYQKGTVEVINTRNEGVIQATYTGETQAYRANLITAVTNDGTNTLFTLIVDGVTYKGVNGNSSIYLANLGNEVINGPYDENLALTLNDDGTFTITPSENQAVAYYKVTIGVYANIDGGTVQQRIHENIKVTGEESYVTTLKNLRFVDNEWLEAHPDAISGELCGYTTYTLDGETYFVLPSLDGATMKGTPKYATLFSVSAYDADGVLLSSAQLGNPSC